MRARFGEADAWVVSVSGGVELDVPRVVNAAEVQADVRRSANARIAESHQLMVVGLNTKVPFPHQPNSRESHVNNRPY